MLPINNFDESPNFLITLVDSASMAAFKVAESISATNVRNHLLSSPLLASSIALNTPFHVSVFRLEICSNAPNNLATYVVIRLSISV